MLVSMLLMLVIFIYWLSNSMVIQLFLMILYVIFNSLMVFYLSDVPMISYLIVFSIVSGLVAVLAFVMLSEPNSESTMIENKKIFIMLTPFMLSISILFTPMEIDSSCSGLLINQFVNFNSFTMDLYLQIFVFLALVMLTMLFVVDLILISYGGSMLPMK